MKSSEFFKKVFSWTLWANLFAMALVVVAACFGVKYGIDLYTHHGERIQVPNVRHKSFADAEHILDKLGLKIEVSDTGYVKVLPPDCILEQSILPGTSVKSGRIVYVVINAANTPTLTIPDVIDNSSYREARAKLEAMGFKVGVCVQFDDLGINSDHIVYQGKATSYADPSKASMTDMQAVDKLFSDWGIDNLIGETGLTSRDQLQNAGAGDIAAAAAASGVARAPKDPTAYRAELERRNAERG